MDVYNSKLAKLVGQMQGHELYVITLGQTAYYSCDKNKVDETWQVHENQHKVQWKRDGRIKFTFRYLTQYITKGYDNIDYEIEARMAAQKGGLV